MAKIMTGKVISTKMKDTIVVEVTRFVPHPLYRKLMKRSKHFKVALNGHEIAVGKRVKIAETKPVAKGKYFKVIEVIAEEHEKTTATKVKGEKTAVVAPSVAKALDGKEEKAEKKVKAKGGTK